MPYAIWCIIPGHGNIFSVDINEDGTVDALKRAIKADQIDDAVATKDLTLYKVNIDIPQDDKVWHRILNEISEGGYEFPNGKTKLHEIRKLSKVFEDGGPREDMLHILVQVPEASDEIPPKRIKRVASTAAVEPPPKKLKIHKDIDTELLARWSKPISALTLESLRQHLELPLGEEEKLPVSQERFDALCRLQPRQYPILPTELSTLFRVSADERAENAYSRFSSALENETPQAGTEDLFHSTYDDNIARIVRFILPDSEYGRNTNHQTSTALQRPDYSLLVNNHCLLRGEEKGSESTGDPEQELTNKLLWTYDPLLYTLGYHARATKVTFVAILVTPLRPETLFRHDLQFKSERIANMVHLIRLCGIIAWMGGVIKNRPIPEFVCLNREGGAVRVTIAKVVMKEFLGGDRVERVEKLRAIYDLLKRKSVPYVDNLDSVDLNPERPRAFLSPVGYDVWPSSGDESFSSVVCVLQALKVLHADPPVYHRDIRAPNIIRRIDVQVWYLIDFSDASTTPTKRATHLTGSEHSPRVQQDDHGPEVDMWGVGKYMKELASFRPCGIARPEAVTQMACRWMEDLATTATAALEEIENIRDIFIAPPPQ